MSKNTIYASPDTQIRKVEYKLVEGEVKKIVAFVAHTYMIDSYDDRGFSDPCLTDWIASEPAQYIIKNSLKTPTIRKLTQPGSYQEQCQVVAYMYEEHVVFYELKWK